LSNYASARKRRCCRSRRGTRWAGGFWCCLRSSTRNCTLRMRELSARATTMGSTPHVLFLARTFRCSKSSFRDTWRHQAHVGSFYLPNPITSFPFPLVYGKVQRTIKMELPCCYDSRQTLKMGKSRECRGSALDPELPVTFPISGRSHLCDAREQQNVSGSAKLLSPFVL
jgi:hypothetical protein